MPKGRKITEPESESGSDTTTTAPASTTASTTTTTPTPTSDSASAADTIPASDPESAVPPNPRTVRRSAEERGRECVGIAPEISRTKLSQATGVHKSQISNVLTGRMEASKKLTEILAPWIGVSAKELGKRLRVQRAVYLASKLGELERAGA